MRKLFEFFICFSLILVLVSACGSNEEASDFPEHAIEFSEEFIKELYTVEDANLDLESMSVEELIEIQNVYEPYLTEEELENFQQDAY